MNEQNNLNGNSNLNGSNNRQNYNDLSLQELRAIAARNEIVPAGNKSLKDTWIQALEEYDRAYVANKKSNNESEPESLTQEFGSAQAPPDKGGVPLTFEQQGSGEAQDYILENILTALDQRRVDVNRLEVSLDGRNIFKMRDGDVASSTINDQQAELIKQALNDPASFKGSIKITNGSQVLLHVKDGRVLRDGLGLTKSSTKVAINSVPADLYNKYSQNVKSKGLKATKEIARDALADGVGQDQVKNMIKSEDSGYQNLLAQSGKDAASNTLDKIVTSALAEVKNQNSLDQSERIRKAGAIASRA